MLGGSILGVSNAQKMSIKVKTECYTKEWIRTIHQDEDSDIGKGVLFFLVGFDFQDLDVLRFCSECLVQARVNIVSWADSNLIGQ